MTSAAALRVSEIERDRERERDVHIKNEVKSNGEKEGSYGGMNGGVGIGMERDRVQAIQLAGLGHRHGGMRGHDSGLGIGWYTCSVLIIIVDLLYCLLYASVLIIILATKCIYDVCVALILTVTMYIDIDNGRWPE